LLVIIDIAVFASYPAMYPSIKMPGSLDTPLF
jgi:hypothetical protein